MEKVADVVERILRTAHIGLGFILMPHAMHVYIMIQHMHVHLVGITGAGSMANHMTTTSG